VLACVRHHADTEDILQDVTVVVLRSFEKLRNTEEFLPWAREIARRHVMAHIRKSNRSISYDPELIAILADAAQEISVGTDYSARDEALHNCLEALPRKSRQIIRMRYDGSVSDVAELAQRLQRTLSATYGVLKRIRLALQQCIQRRLEAEERR